MAYCYRIQLATLGAALLLTTPAAAFEGPESGFVINTDLTGGVASVGAVSGLGTGLALRLGYAIDPGVVLSVEHRYRAVRALDLDIFCGAEAPCDPPDEVSGGRLRYAGASATLYRDGGLFLRLGAGWLWSTVTFNDVPSISERNTFAGQIGAGMEWWGADDWGVGLVADAVLPSADLAEEYLFNVGLSLTWN